jgi:hypothetical protein
MLVLQLRTVLDGSGGTWILVVRRRSFGGISRAPVVEAIIQQGLPYNVGLL